MSAPARAGASNGAGRAFLPLSRAVRVRVGPTLSATPARGQARTRTPACKGILVCWDLRSGLERRRIRKLLARSEPAFDEKMFGSGVSANSTIYEE